MKTYTIMIALCCLALLPSVRGDEAMLKRINEAQVEMINSTGSANFAVACINVTRDVRDKKLRIYALSSDAKTGFFKEGDVTIEVIYNQRLVEADGKAVGAYHHHNNGLLISYAGWLVSSGDKALGLSLVRMIAAANPDMRWSSPTQSPTSIQKILAGLEKDDDSIRHFLDDCKRNWPDYVKVYGPKP